MKALPLKTKLFLAITSINFLIISVIAVMIYVSNINEMKRQSESLSNVLATQFTRSIDLYMQDIESLSIGLFTDPVIQSSLSADSWLRTPYEEFILKNDLYSQLFNQSYPRRDIAGITLYTLDNIAYEYVNQGNVETVFIAEPTEWSEELDTLNKSEFMLLPTQEVEYSNGTTEEVVSFVRNIYTIPQRDKIGMMKIDLNIDGFSNLLNFENVNNLLEYLQVFIVDQDDTIIFSMQEEHSSKSFPNARNSSDSDLSGLFEPEDIFLTTSYLSDYTSWHTYIVISEDFFVYERNQILLFIFYSGIPVILLSGIVSYFLSLQITKPIRGLIEKMRMVEQGGLQERMNYSGAPEMDVLSRVYNQMLESINRLINEVYESKITEKNAKIAALQSQINPHFLYNTLNVMKSISRIRQVEEVAEISESLADLFKYNTKNPDKLVHLIEEVTHIMNYMNIQKHRFLDRYDIEIHLPRNLEKVLIPKLIIQPLIENCINHGLKNISYKGKIKLEITEKMKDLIIRVSDNGEGMTDQRLKEVRSKLDSERIIDIEGDSGLGLINTHVRVKMMYGKEYGLNIGPADKGGTFVTITMPIVTDEMIKRRANA